MSPSGLAFLILQGMVFLIWTFLAFRWLFALRGIAKLFEPGSDGPDEDKSGGHLSSVVCPQTECVSPRVAV